MNACTATFTLVLPIRTGPPVSRGTSKPFGSTKTRSGEVPEMYDAFDLVIDTTSDNDLAAPATRMSDQGHAVKTHIGRIPDSKQPRISTISDATSAVSRPTQGGKVARRIR